jgi:acetyl esterase/lipase
MPHADRPEVRPPAARWPLLLLAAGACSGNSAEQLGARQTDAAGEAAARVESCPPASRAARDAVQTIAGQTYAIVNGQPLQLDLARPRAPGPYPLVVLLHGGGWEGGDRRDMQGDMMELASRGYVAATVSYRLTRAPRNVFPAAVQDVRCAIGWLRARADSFAIDPTRVGALGFSAGAHLASMLGVAATEPALDGPCGAPAAAAVQAVVSVAGPQDLRVDGPYTAEQERLVTNFLGVFPGDAPAVARLASPIAHVGAGDAPFLLVHGTDDRLVPVQHARRMEAALRAAGVAATRIELRGVGHSYAGLTPNARPVVACTVFAFFDRWLRAPGEPRDS